MYHIEITGDLDGPIPSEKGSFYKQTAYLHGVGKYPERIGLFCRSEAEAQKPGMYDYQVEPYVGKFNSLQFKVTYKPQAK